MTRCPSCHGHGEVVKWAIVEVRDPVTGRSVEAPDGFKECSKCNGDGKVVCGVCGGSGLILSRLILAR